MAKYFLCFSAPTTMNRIVRFCTGTILIVDEASHVLRHVQCDFNEGGSWWGYAGDCWIGWVVHLGWWSLHMEQISAASNFFRQC